MSVPEHQLYAEVYAIALEALMKVEIPRRGIVAGWPFEVMPSLESEADRIARRAVARLRTAQSEDFRNE